jgi:hypothetical protein
MQPQHWNAIPALAGFVENHQQGLVGRQCRRGRDDYYRAQQSKACSPQAANEVPRRIQHGFPQLLRRQRGSARGAQTPMDDTLLRKPEFSTDCNRTDLPR